MTNNTQAIPTFADYYHAKVAEHTANAERLTYQAFANRTNRAKRPLQCANEANFYTVAYAMQHYQSFMNLLETNTSVDAEPLSLNIVDYGCGQGVATVALLDFVASQVGKMPVSLNIHLLEPSSISLNNAKALITERAATLGFDVCLTSQNTELANVVIPSHIVESDETTVHLFSNVLDVVCVQLSLGHVVAQIKRLMGKSMVLASAPNYSESYKGFRQLSAQLMGNACPVIDEYHVEHYSYRVIQNRWATMTAKNLAMVLSYEPCTHQRAA